MTAASPKKSPKKPGWTAADIPDLRGRTIIVTGANSGLGFVTASELAGHGASVILAVRDLARGEDAARRILAGLPADRAADAAVQVRELDLSSLASVRSFASAWLAEHPEGLDVLVNNAGVMNVPERRTVDGFELQFGTNHLGHFALTGLLLPGLLARAAAATAPDAVTGPDTGRKARVVTLSSALHRRGRMDFDDLMGAQKYRAWAAYGQSKLANLLFTSELQRRADAAGAPLLALAAHPGYARTNLQSVGATMRGNNNGFERRLTDLANRVLAQPAEMGALPTLYAATEPGLAGNTFVGPDGFGEQHGHPHPVGRSERAGNHTDAVRLWSESERLTGVTFDLG
ncbi:MULTISPECIES: oxidoreductase [unclassified Cryobacterium]|uniref:oxidoreductase n=1 Tax=unclassified Cryobacterium TaxID=2649013 RepID=UPI00106AEDE8|nr:MULTISPECIES: oxidoreductase [unclassified Cryobacterium]TFB93792.1 SDR family NAD(P)-dependent oxidoreductase [Cryobacterium sp. MDB2-A-1]TFC08997.1 SDR family NAD(P)-dependent oxidoreductase [Cryobacterium sp. MDB2-33-2]TFC14777.1 SDR family NAD(P)-dependent oxidoreductase [Cryobacterium sp. MDB2-A-2]TFC19075.1 SDR family NAD(P)-dependent oxidoreductase [Cryobacterium sp. MDB2-10]